MPIPKPARHSMWNVRSSSCKSNGTSSFEMTTLSSPTVCHQSQSQSAISAILSLVTLPGCKTTFQLTKHSTATLTYCSDIHQVANRTVVQAVPTTDGSTRFGGTTTSRPLTSGGMLSVVVTTGATWGPLPAKHWRWWRLTAIHFSSWKKQADALKSSNALTSK